VFLTFVGWKIINCLHESMHPQVLTIGGNWLLMWRDDHVKTILVI
jgi:hypothetical protein